MTPAFLARAHRTLPLPLCEHRKSESVAETCEGGNGPEFYCVPVLPKTSTWSAGPADDQKMSGLSAESTRRRCSCSTKFVFSVLTLSFRSAMTYSHITEVYKAGLTQPERQRFSWSLPPSSSSDDSLGNGITYAIDPFLCEQLLPRFREQSQDTWAKVLNLGVTFVDCADIYDAFGRAFGTWSSNHKLIAFKDVSKLCANGGNANAKSMGCELAEVTINAREPTQAETDLAAWVIDYPSKGTSSAWTRKPNGRRTTAGIDVPNGYAIRFSTMTFNTAQCWYLDNTFCAPLHALTVIVDLMLRVGLLLLWILGFVMLVLWLFSAGQQAHAEISADGDHLESSRGARVGAGFRTQPMSRPEAGAWRRRLSCCRAAGSGLLDAVERLSGLNTTLCLLLLVAPPLIYIRIYLPCKECYDFEAAAAHEIGHILGFFHPNQEGVSNYFAAAGPMGVSICNEPLENLEQLGSVSLLSDSIMFSTTTHKARSCLSSDDLDGLNYLYPSCDLVRAERPLCIKSRRRSGYLRMLLAMGVPVLLGVLLAQLLVCYAAQRERKRFTQLANDLHVIKSAGALGALQQFDMSRLRRRRWWKRSAGATPLLGGNGRSKGFLRDSRTMRDFAEAARTAAVGLEGSRRRANARAGWLACGSAAVAALTTQHEDGSSADSTATTRGDAPRRKQQVSRSADLSEAIELFEPAPIFAWVRKGEIANLRGPLSRLSGGLREMHEELTDGRHGDVERSGGSSASAARGKAAGRRREWRTHRMGGALRGGKIGAKNDIYRRLSNQLPVCVDAFIDGEEIESRDLATVIRRVEALETAGLRHVQAAQDSGGEPYGAKAGRMKQPLPPHELAPADGTSADESAYADARVLEPEMCAAKGVDSSQATLAPLAPTRGDTFLAWDAWLKADPRDPLPKITPKPEDLRLPWESPTTAEVDTSYTAVTQRATSGPQWQAEDEAAAWAAWTKPRAQDRPVRTYRVSAIACSVASTLRMRGGVRGGGNVRAQSASGCRGLRYAPLVRKEDRSSFLRWFASVSQIVERSEGNQQPANGERKEAAAEANAAMHTVLKLIASLEGRASQS